MPRIKEPTAFKVIVREYNRGYGRNIIETAYFDNYTEAFDYVNNINSKNTDISVPDYYIIAEYRGKI